MNHNGLHDDDAPECHCLGAFLAAGFDELLHCEKSNNALEYRRILQRGLLSTNEKRNDQML